MISGYAPSAGDPQSESSTALTAGPPIDLSTTGAEEYPLRIEDLNRALLAAFRSGFEIGQIPAFQKCPEVRFEAKVDPESRSVDISATVL